MSINSKYGGYVYMWSEKTWNDKFIEIFGNNKDNNQFLSKFADPRIIWNAGYPIKIKDKYFEEFKIWALNQGYQVTNPEPTFSSISYFCEIYKLSIEDIDRIKSIQFKENK